MTTVTEHQLFNNREPHVEEVDENPNSANVPEQFSSTWDTVLVSILALLFGTGSWIALTGLWLEMPLLLQQLPESWTLASHMNIMIQLANVGPLIYWVARRRSKLVNDISATHAQICTGLISCSVLIAAWSHTVWIGSHEHSLILLLATFGLALVDCTSSVTFLPFMARFDSSYLLPYLIGEGLSGFIPSMVALLQGVGEEQRQLCPVQTLLNETFNSNSVIEIESRKTKMIEPSFSVEVFFFSLLVTLSVSYLAFILLQTLPVCVREMAKARRRRSRAPKQDYRPMELEEKDETAIELMPGGSGIAQGEKLMSQHSAGSRQMYFYLLFLIFWCNFITLGFMQPLQPYSALPYGSDMLHFTVILASLSYPIGCFFGMLAECRSIRLNTTLIVFGTIISIYILSLALLSPNPPLLDNPRLGGILMVLAWVALVTTVSYAKTMITVVICDYNSRKGMFWVGMFTQLGAALGAFLNFALINWTTLFQQCPKEPAVAL